MGAMKIKKTRKSSKLTVVVATYYLNDPDTFHGLSVAVCDAKGHEVCPSLDTRVENVSPEALAESGDGLAAMALVTSRLGQQRTAASFALDWARAKAPGARVYVVNEPVASEICEECGGWTVRTMDAGQVRAAKRAGY